MECVDTGRASQFAFTARRNNSLSTSGRLLVFCFVFFVSVGIGLAFTLVFGAWPIMPFAGVEMLVLYLAFRYIERHAMDYERLAIAGDRVEVEVLDGGRLSRFDCNRHWTRVVCDGKGGRLALRSHGREVEIGRHLNQEQRLSVARQLGRVLHDAR
ncbi:MAG TPA: DUF2244 domain-containing protein [Burkholderiales bacterium]|nr:DUF2244 domain-containing protein [Burkholderiales bacterium]